MTSGSCNKKSNLNENGVWGYLVPLLGNWYANTAHVFLLTYAFKYAKMGGVNQGIIPIVTTTAILYNSVAFYCHFGEKVSPMKIVGMLVTVGCVVCLAIDSAQGRSQKGGQVQYEIKYAFYSLGLAVIVPINFSIKHFLIRKYKCDSKNLSIDSAILESLTYCIFVAPYINQNGFWSLKMLLLGSLAGCLLIAGRILIEMAVSEGLGGPA